MSHKTVLLTGATSGIGEAAAIALANQGYSLYLTARNKTKAKDTEEKIRDQCANADVNWLYGDFSSLQDVRSIADQFLSANVPLDLLFNNAGVTYNDRTLSTEGYEMMFAVNHLAPFLLTNLLIDKMLQGDNELRVISTSSGAYNFVKAFNIEDVNWEENFKTFPAYGNSKLANILFTKQLAEKLAELKPEKSISVNCFHPGFVGTGIGTQTTFGKIIMTLISPFARSPAKGADTGLYIATSADLKDSSGGFYYNRKEQKLKAYACDMDMAKRLWQKSLELTGLPTE